jgi:hypothetical protein
MATNGYFMAATGIFVLLFFSGTGNVRANTHVEFGSFC